MIASIVAVAFSLSASWVAPASPARADQPLWRLPETGAATADFSTWISTCRADGQEPCDFGDAWDCSVPNAGEIALAIATAGIGTAAHEHYKEMFSRACVRHDGCYRHGSVTYGHSRAACDRMFRDDMHARCDEISGWSHWLTLGVNKAGCHKVADIYYIAVDKAGADSYRGRTDATVCHYDQANENAHVHLIGSNGGLGPAQHRYMWTSGWWVTNTYTIGGVDYLLMLKPGNGRVHIHRPRATGTVGQRMAAYNWSDGWSIAEPYVVGGKAYLMLIKTLTGTAHLHQLNDDGTVGTRISTSEYSKHWTTVESYQAGGSTYIVFLKGRTLYPPHMIATAGNTGLARIYRMNTDGTLGPRVAEHDWSGHTSILKAYRAGDNTYLLRLRSSDGHAVVNRVKSDGTLTPAVHSYNWSQNYTTAEFFETGGVSYLFLLRAGDGVAVVLRVNADGSIGPIVQEYNWRRGWTSSVFYRVDGQLYGFIMKASAGGTT